MIATTAKTKDRRSKSKPRRPRTVVPQVWLATFQQVLTEAAKLLATKPVEISRLRKAVRLAANRWDG